MSPDSAVKYFSPIAKVNNTTLLLLLLLLLSELLTSRLWLENIQLSWDVVIERIKLGDIIYSLKSNFLNYK